MRNSKSKKLIATMLTTVMLTVPTYQAIAIGPSTNNLKAVNINALESNSISELSKSSTGKHVITLITGDVVTVTDLADGKSVISVEPADRAGGGARIFTVGKDTYVIPNQAIAYLASDLFDKDLFNITELIANGYDDGKQSTLPVIVQYTPTMSRSVPALPAAAPEGSKRTHVLESIGSVAVSADKKQAKSFWKDITKGEKDENGITPTNGSSIEETVQLKDGIEKIWLDGRVKANLEQSVPQVEAPKAWGSGYDGTGVKIAVLDTGIDTEHPDVADQMDEAVSFVPGEDVFDHHAHGTHVASTVLGTGAASEGLNKGVAPGARLLVGKVLGNDGYGQDSWIIDGMEWAANNAKIVSMSLGGTEPSDGTDPMSQAVNKLSAETGALFVIAAGNTGSEGIGSPGAADAALTVGAVDKSDQLAWFSSKGPRNGNSGLKPDLVAPGVGIVAARSHLSNQGSGSYLSLDGTSMATPHVAGAAAILLQRHPDWTGAQLKDALMSTTKKLDYIKPFEGGTGRLDVAAATFGTVRATGSLDFGFFDWPHDGDVPVEKTVTYTNDSDMPVTLDLSAIFTDNIGSEAPAGLLTLSANQVTVPAKGTADVTVTIDPDKGALGSRYQGQLSANVDGQTVVHTAIGMMKEDERYSLTIKATDRDGSPNRAIVSLVGPNKDPEFLVVEGTKELRLPAGTYSVMSLMDVDVNTDHAGVALVGNPEVNLNGSKTVELDARKASEYTVNVPKKNEASFRRMEYYRTFGGYNTMNALYILPVWVDKMYAEPTAAVNFGELDVSTRWRLIQPLLTINFKGNELDNIPQAGSKLLEGKYHLDAIYAGNGAPEEYKTLNAQGKVVVVERSDEISGSQRSAAAYAAGAKLLITVNDDPKELSEFVGVENEDFTLSDTPLAVASVSRTEGEELIEATKFGDVKLNVEGTPNTPYVYDLVDSYQKMVPEDLTYSPKPNELVQIDSQYKSDRLAPGAEFRWDIRPYSTYGAGFLYNLSLPSVRTEWVSAEEGTSWYHQANVLDSVWEVRQPVVTYNPGQRLEEEWFAPVIRPRFGEGYWTPRRVGNNFQFNIPSLADSGIGHTGAGNYPPEQTLKLYQGSSLLSEQQNAQDFYIFNPLPVENTEYRLVSDASRDEDRWATSVRTHTEWTFWSKQQEQINTDLPLISLDYQVDTDLSGYAAGGDTTKLGLSAVQINGALGNGKINDASLEVSFNEGKTWEKVHLVRNENGWIADIKNPRIYNNFTFVSLRASAWDDVGNRIDQEIIKAYGLNPVAPPVKPPITNPIVPKAPIIHLIDDNDTTITGKADANVSISVNINGDVVASGKTNAEGNYSIPISQQQAGTVINVIATDAAGVQSEVTSITVLDRTAPKAPIINVMDDNDTKITGRAEANATIFVKNKDVVIATGIANGQGEYSIAISPQKAGTVITVSATDAAKNQSEVKSITVLDRTAPKAPIINVMDDNDTKISGKAEANVTIVVKNNGKTIATGKANSLGVYSIKLTQQKAGTVISVTATDKSGNQSTTSKIKVLDKTAPKAPKISSFILKNKNQIQMKGTAEANSTITVKIGNKVMANVKVSTRGTFSVNVSKVGKGKNEITLYGIDAAGNKSSLVKRTVTIK